MGGVRGAGRGGRTELWAPPDGGSAPAPHRAFTCTRFWPGSACPAAIAFASVRAFLTVATCLMGRVGKVPPPPSQVGSALGSRSGQPTGIMIDGRSGGCRPGRSNRIVGPSGPRFCSGTASSDVHVHDSGPVQPVGPPSPLLPSAFLTVATCLRAELEKFHRSQHTSALHSSPLSGRPTGK